VSRCEPETFFRPAPALRCLAGLGAAFGELVRVEAALVAPTGDRRRHVEREAQALRTRDLPGLGPSGEGYRAARPVLALIGDASNALSTSG